MQLFSFTEDERPELRQLAIKNIAGLTGSRENFAHFKQDDYYGCRSAMALIKDEPVNILLILKKSNIK